MNRVCSQCHKPGHNARTCSKAGGAKKSPGPPAPRRAAAAAPAPIIASPGVADGASVLDSLKARRAQLQHELAGIDRKQRELKLVEGMIDELEELGASA